MPFENRQSDDHVPAPTRLLIKECTDAIGREFRDSISEAISTVKHEMRNDRTAFGDRMREVETTLNGEKGEPGLVGRTDRNTQSINLVRWIGGLVATVIIGIEVARIWGK